MRWWSMLLAVLYWVGAIVILLEREPSGGQYRLTDNWKAVLKFVSALLWPILCVIVLLDMVVRRLKS